MNVEEKLQQGKSQSPIHIVNKEKFTESFWAKVDQLDKVQKVYRKRRRIAISTAAIVLVGGIAMSPIIATAAQKIPLVHVVLNWVKGTDAAPYVQTIQQSSTSHGITMTITDVLYGPSRLSFGYIVTPGQSGFPHGGAVTLGSPSGMEFFVNGEPVRLQGIGQDEATAYGFKGLVTLTDAGTATSLPSTFHFQIVLHKIGHQRGTWMFNVPVSRTNMTPEQSFLPMVTKQVGNDTITVKEVQLYPTGGMIDYDVTVPVGVRPSLYMNLFNQNKGILDSVSALPETAQSHAKHGGFETWSYAQSFRIPGQKPTSLIISASIPSESQPKPVPITGPFPVTVTSGVFGKLTITGADVKGNTVTVYYTSQSKPNQPGFGFSIDDATKQNERFGGTIGQHVGPSGSNTYMNVYHFSNDVSSDNLMLRLPTQTQGNVFDVPLRTNPN
jgi:hypothetical protein